MFALSLALSFVLVSLFLIAKSGRWTPKAGRCEQWDSDSMSYSQLHAPDSCEDWRLHSDFFAACKRPNVKCNCRGLSKSNNSAELLLLGKHLSSRYLHLVITGFLVEWLIVSIDLPGDTMYYM